VCRAVLILPTKFLEKYNGKSKEQMPGNFGRMDAERLELSVSCMATIEIL